MYAIKNYMEDVVLKLADQYIKETGMCKCEKCRMDVMALALNQLPAAYFVTRTGELFEAVDAVYLQNQINAKVAVMRAIHTVRANPRHECLEEEIPG